LYPKTPGNLRTGDLRLQTIGSPIKFAIVPGPLFVRSRKERGRRFRQAILKGHVSRFQKNFWFELGGTINQATIR
jgi:hypothetical protein